MQYINVLSFSMDSKLLELWYVYVMYVWIYSYMNVHVYV